MTKRIRTAVRQVSPFVFAGVAVFTASPETQESMLWMYAVLTALFTGWYIIAKFNHRRWLAAAPQREAESRARTRAIVEAHFARQEELRAEQSTADWFNWDGPYTVAGQPR